MRTNYAASVFRELRKIQQERELTGRLRRRGR